MKTLFDYTPVVLYLFVGAVSVMMAQKTILSKKFLPFHEEASGGSWEAIGEGLKLVLLALMKTTGLGFLIAGFLLIFFPIVNVFHPDVFLRYAVPSLCLFYCLGLALINLRLAQRTGARTPWKRSLYAALAILIGLVISIADQAMW